MIASQEIDDPALLMYLWEERLGFVLHRSSASRLNKLWHMLTSINTMQTIQLLN